MINAGLSTAMKVVNARDDRVAATRYAVIMLRRATTYYDAANKWPKLEYDMRGIV